MGCSLPRRNSLRRALVPAALAMLAPAGLAHAYTAAGDRIFPATLVIPQIGPSDEIYETASTLPTSDGRTTSLGTTYAKTITERFGLEIDQAYSWLDHKAGGTSAGWANQTASLRYLAVLDAPREFLLTVGMQQEFGNTGTLRTGASRNGATTPMVYFGKGLGDLDIGYLRPLAISGTFGYAASDGGPRPDQVVAGLVVEYSIPYLEAKVAALKLPAFFRSLTPMVEYFYTTTTTPSHGQSTTATAAPGLSFSGPGWEFALEALVPATHATGTGPGVIAQFHLSLDYLFPDSIGKPLFPW